MENIFGHEQLNAYKLAIQFEAWLSSLIKSAPDLAKALEDVHKISSSISAKIAEGNVRLSLNERFALFDNALDAAIDSAVALDIIVAEYEMKEKQMKEKEIKETIDEIKKGKDTLKKIVSEISKLRSKE